MRSTPETRHQAPPAITVMGVSGSGKSTLGAMLARQLGCAFLEGDDFHAPASVEKMRHGIALVDEDRWPWLDQLGAAARQAIARDGLVVLACSALRRAYRDRLTTSAGHPVAFVFLNASPTELARRLEDRPGHFMSPALLGSQLATLEPPQSDEYALTLGTTHPPAELCRDVLAWLEERGAVTRSN